MLSFESNDSRINSRYCRYRMPSMEKLTKTYNLCFDNFLSGNKIRTVLLLANNDCRLLFVIHPRVGEEALKHLRPDSSEHVHWKCIQYVFLLCSWRCLTYSGVIFCRLFNVSPVTTRLCRYNSFTHRIVCLFRTSQCLINVYQRKVYTDLG